MEEALGNEFSFFRPGLGGLRLLEHLATAQSTLTGRLEFAHVFTVTTDLFLLGVDTASKQATVRDGLGRKDLRRGCNNKGLLEMVIDHVDVDHVGVCVLVIDIQEQLNEMKQSSTSGREGKERRYDAK